MKGVVFDKSMFSSRNFYQLLLYAIILGAIVGLVTALFLLTVHWLTELIWQEIPRRFGTFHFYALLVCSIGGLLVGLCQHFLGNYPKPMREALEDVRTQGSFDVKHLPHGVVASLVSLCFGAALGPEAALISLAGGLGTWVSRFIKASAQQAYAFAYFSVSAALGAFFHSPFGSAALPLESLEEDAIPSTWVMIPGVFAGLAGLVVTLFLAGDVLRASYDYLPYESPGNGTDLLIALPLGLVGAILIWFHLQFQRGLNRLLHPLARHKIMRGLLGGIVLGLLATFFPLVLFSGEAGLDDLFVHGETMGVAMLFLLGFAKLLALGICVSTGWKGGEFFPVMFSGASIGLAIAYLIPCVNPMVGLTTVMAASTAAMLRKPLATVLIVALFIPGTLLVPITVGAFIGATVSLSKLFKNTIVL